MKWIFHPSRFRKLDQLLRRFSLPGAEQHAEVRAAFSRRLRELARSNLTDATLAEAQLVLAEITEHWRVSGAKKRHSAE